MNREKFDHDFDSFRQQCNALGMELPKYEDRISVLDDDSSAHTAKDYTPDYLAHCAWAARQLASTRPEHHVDVGSYVYFAALCSAFVTAFHFYDIRALGCDIPGLTTGEADLLALPFADDSRPSISCLHVIEHVGLGRYGDTMDATGHWKALKELIRVLKPGGRLLLVLPMNKWPRTNFNAHRIVGLEELRAKVEEFGAKFKSVQFMLPNGSFVTQEPHGDYTGCMVISK